MYVKRGVLTDRLTQQICVVSDGLLKRLIILTQRDGKPNIYMYSTKELTEGYFRKSVLSFISETFVFLYVL